MSFSEDDDAAQFLVLVNREEQYSLWPAGKAAPDGWREAGKAGNRSECVAFIDDVWTDMRPMSLRQKMAQATS